MRKPLYIFYTTKVIYVVNWKKAPLVIPMPKAGSFPLIPSSILFILVATF